MKFYFRALPLIAFAMVIFACSEKKSSLLNETVQKDNLVEISDKIAEDKDMTREQINFLSAGLDRMSRFQDSVVGKTVGEIIEAQKKYVHELSARELKINATQAQIAFTHGFKFNKLIKVDNDTMQANVFTFALSNNADKSIKNVQGLMNIVNSRNQVLEKYQINVTKVFKPGESIDVQTVPYAHNPQNMNHLLIRRAKDRYGKSLRSIWQPLHVEFEDGEVISLLK